MADSALLQPDQIRAVPESEDGDRFGPNVPPGANESLGRAKGAAERGFKLLPALGVLAFGLIIIILVLMWLTPGDNFFLHFKVKADPLDNLNGWFIIRPAAGQQTELFTLALAREAETVYQAQGKAAQGADDQGSALMMIGCVEGRVMPPTFAFSQLIAVQQDFFLPHPPKPCALSYRVDGSEALSASCVFDGLVASLVQPPGPRDHLQDANQMLLNSAEQGRRLTVYLSIDAGQALTAHFDVSKLALARMRLQRACGQY